MKREGGVTIAEPGSRTGVRVDFSEEVHSDPGFPEL